MRIQDDSVSDKLILIQIEVLFMKLSEISHILEKIAPSELAEDFDHGKIGPVIDLGNEINKIAVSLDATDYVLKRAAEIEADLLIVHHTPIFTPITSIKEALAEKIRIALENEISIYVMHTNYDKAEGGVNDVLAKKLGLTHIEKLDMGRIGTIPRSSSISLAKHVSKCLDTPIQYVGEREDIKRVMTIAGSGFKEPYIQVAREKNVDAVISGELKHSVIREYEDMVLIDATHYATENPAMKELSSKLKEKIDIDIEFIDHNPFIRFTE
ncbi:protein of unknown function DUF34 [Methanosalsum zhilinae DSM 4017]|uniref:NGG1p interacting factor 3 protein, NIF3 n=1 Tax=Methanosalsum zhilinae (strain DSM 4017 / NBRC 107636 / OCM 62 / WeN5) TaxID=679901 RepID=F7XK79_METZD|nr:protein of unknown function DUF34 [Methanosalsum zhilinae DSM 4017]